MTELIPLEDLLIESLRPGDQWIFSKEDSLFVVFKKEKYGPVGKGIVCEGMGLTPTEALNEAIRRKPLQL